MMLVEYLTMHTTHLMSRCRSATNASTASIERIADSDIDGFGVPPTAASFVAQ